jgi:tetratricopeptide (TPR) repeat protein
MPIPWLDWLECYIFYREARELVIGTLPAEDPRLNAHYERSLATITTGDAFTFMESGRKHLAAKEWDSAASDFAKTLEQLSYGNRFSVIDTRMILEIAAQPEVFDRLVHLRPDDWCIWLARGRLFSNKRDWEKACADYDRTLPSLGTSLAGAESGPGANMVRTRAGTLQELAALRLLTGDDAGYRSLCDALLPGYAKIEDPVSASLASRTLSLSPIPSSEASVASIALADLAVTRSPVAWNHFSRGLAYCRAGRFEETITQLEESLRVHPAWIGRGQDYALLAIACEKLQRHEQAQDWLRKAHTLTDETDARYSKTLYGYASTEYLGDWLTLQVLMREADSLVKTDAAAAPPG